MRDEVDRMLDAALECYSLQEPRPGLPGRVLARVGSDAGVARRKWFGFVFAIATAAACLIIWRPMPPQLTLTLAPPSPPPVPELRVSVLVRPRPRQAERPLIALTSMPPEAALWLADADQPLEVKPLEIKPLQIESIETGELK